MRLEEIIAKYRTEENPDYDTMAADIMASEEWTGHEAEIASLREENAQLIQAAADQKKELEETKKLNFTLGRQVSRQPVKSAEELINDMLI